LEKCDVIAFLLESPVPVVFGNEDFVNNLNLPYHPVISVPEPLFSMDLGLEVKSLKQRESEIALGAVRAGPP